MFLGLKRLDRLRGLLCLLTSERGPFRALKMRPVRQGLSTVCGVGCSAGL